MINFIKTYTKINRYKILAPAAVEKESDLKKCAGFILDGAGLDPDKFRLGHTKACLKIK